MRKPKRASSPVLPCPRCKGHKALKPALLCLKTWQMQVAPCGEQYAAMERYVRRLGG